MIEFFTRYLGIFIVAGLIALYIITYTLNKRTPIPEECLEDIDKAACTSCHNFACAHKG